MDVLKTLDGGLKEFLNVLPHRACVDMLAFALQLSRKTGRSRRSIGESYIVEMDVFERGRGSRVHGETREV